MILLVDIVYTYCDDIVRQYRVSIQYTISHTIYIVRNISFFLILAVVFRHHGIATVILTKYKRIFCNEMYAMGKESKDAHVTLNSIITKHIMASICAKFPQ